MKPAETRRAEDTSHRQGHGQRGDRGRGRTEEEGRRGHTGSQSINGRVLLIELPTNSVFMRLRRRVHECWGRGKEGVETGLGQGQGSRVSSNRKPAN